jgi:serine/threonine-protein kinase
MLKTNPDVLTPVSGFQGQGSPWTSQVVILVSTEEEQVIRNTDAGSEDRTTGSRANGGASKVTSGTSTGSGSTPSWMGKRVGRFRLVGLLGQGAMGRVFRAEDTMLRRQVALKVLPKTVKRGQRTVEAERLIREARAAATLEHPNAVQVFEVNEVGGVYYIAMELVEAGSLRELVEGHGPLDYVRACQLAAEAADALAHAHSMGIVHRDVKPANLLLSRTGRVKVADFGLARVEDASDLTSFLAESVGTPQFVAPEILQGVAATGKSDLYSLGATLWYLLTGKPPFEAGTTEELLHKHVNAPLPNLKKLRPDLPDGLVRAITTALAKDPGRRHGTTEQFASALRVHTIPVGASTQSLGHIPIQVMDAGQQQPISAGRPKWLLPVSIGGAAVAAAVVIGVIAFRGGAPARTEASNLPSAAAQHRPAPLAPQQPARDPIVDAQPEAAAAASQAPAVTQAPTVVMTPAPAPAPAAPVTASPHIVNLMPMIDPPIAAVAGTWRFDKGDLVSDDGRPATLQIPYTPPAEYDFRVDFTPTADENSVQQHLYKAPFAFTWAMGTKHDCGFEFVDGKHVWDSPFKNTDRIQANQRYTSVVRVREGRVQAFLNGKLVVDASTNYANFSKNPEFSQPDNTRLGLGTFHAPVRFHKVEVIEGVPAAK